MQGLALSQCVLLGVLRTALTRRQAPDSCLHSCRDLELIQGT